MWYIIYGNSSGNSLLLDVEKRWYTNLFIVCSHYFGDHLLVTHSTLRWFLKVNLRRNDRSFY